MRKMRKYFTFESREGEQVDKCTNRQTDVSKLIQNLRGERLRGSFLGECTPTSHYTSVLGIKIKCGTIKALHQRRTIKQIALKPIKVYSMLFFLCVI